ncbi:putative tRNA pseudouridine synthase D [uncultured archaeon]|nr:putative tRNA pseudouridine synthase D [uncultured archaeon]
MKYLLSTETFSVKELFNPHLKEKGNYYYYLLEKKGMSHKEAVNKIGIKPVWFAGVKDKNAKTTQWFCALERIGDVDEDNFKIKYKGQSDERIFVGKHKENEFTISAELEEGEKESLKHFKTKKELICNYFGKQRFSEQNIEIIEALEKEAYENALRLFLTKRNKHDSEKSRAIKGLIEKKWEKWGEILADEKITGTKKTELFEFLEKNPADFEGAFLHAEPKSVRIIIKAAQAKRFNAILNELAEKKKPNNIHGEIVEQFGSYALGASKAFTRSISVAPTKFEQRFRKGTLDRKTFFTAEKFGYKIVEENKIEFKFCLPRGTYATVFLKYLSAWLNNAKKQRKKD